MKTMKDYHNLYLKFGVLLLVDVFEKFQNNSIKNFGLCQSLFEYIEKDTGSEVSNRYSKINNKYLKSYLTQNKNQNIL